MGQCPFLFKLIKYLSLHNSLYYNAELIWILLSNFNIDVETIIKYKKLENYFEKEKDNLKIIKFLYYNRQNIHQFLFNEEKFIELDDEIEENYLSYYFYLFLLIKDSNNNIINYIYKFKYINKINDIYKRNKSGYKEYSKSYSKLIISKIILELINNYIEIDESLIDENEIDKNEIDEALILFKNKYSNKIKKIINEFDLNRKEDYYERNIDELYIAIIIDLIKKRKFEDFEYTLNLIKELEIDKIDMTKNMFDKINNDCFKNEINEYLINQKEDLFNIKKINLYYLLTKYILKNNIFIYQIDFLSKTRNNIMKIIKQNPKILADIKIEDKNIKERLEEFLSFILDSNYYIHKYITLNINNSYISSNNNKLTNIKTKENKENKENEKFKANQKEEKNKEEAKNKINQNIININYINSIYSDLNITSTNQQNIFTNINSSNSSNINKSSYIQQNISSNVNKSNKTNIQESSSKQQNINYNSSIKSSGNLNLYKSNNQLENPNNSGLEQNNGSFSISSYYNLNKQKNKEKENVKKKILYSSK